MSYKLYRWLSNSITESPDGRYRYRHLREDPSHRSQAQSELKTYVQEAHEDARRYLRKALIPLDPLESGPKCDPCENYPSGLPLSTLKGYFGEIVAGLIAEYFNPIGEAGWKVPAFLFRFHQAAFHQLERARQTGDDVRGSIGRLGDDCLAFRRDNDGHIVRALFCEGKCTHDHDAGQISDGHEKLSSQPEVT
jgi:hypothetical protein